MNLLEKKFVIFVKSSLFVDLYCKVWMVLRFQSCTTYMHGLGVFLGDSEPICLRPFCHSIECVVLKFCQLFRLLLSGRALRLVPSLGPLRCRWSFFALRVANDNLECSILCKILNKVQHGKCGLYDVSNTYHTPSLGRERPRLFLCKSLLGFSF
jgi:hypothetical protein